MREPVATFLVVSSPSVLGGCAANGTFSQGGTISDKPSGTTTPETTANPPAVGSATDGGGTTPVGAWDGETTNDPPNRFAPGRTHRIRAKSQAARGDRPCFKTLLAREGSSILADYKNYYSWETLRDMSLGLAIAAPLPTPISMASLRPGIRLAFAGPGATRLPSSGNHLEMASTHCRYASHWQSPTTSTSSAAIPF